MEPVKDTYRQKIGHNEFHFENRGNSSSVFKVKFIMADLLSVSIFDRLHQIYSSGRKLEKNPNDNSC